MSSNNRQLRLPKNLAAMILAAGLLAGCSSAPVMNLGLDKYALRPPERNLSQGIRSYENGNYKAASKFLQEAIDGGLTFPSDRVTAHKYLAFIDCVSDKMKQCRDEFRKILQINPSFELSTAEAGHPIWGPVFSSVKAEMAPTPRP